MNKKAISPLLATVFLIAFAVSLAVIVININAVVVEPGNATIEVKVNENEACKGVNLEVAVIDTRYVCYRNESGKTFIDYILKNIGEKSVRKLKVIILGTKGSSDRTFTLNEEWEPLELLDKRNAGVEFNATRVGIPKEVTFVPIIYYKNQEVKCTRQYINYKDPLECE